MKMMKKIKELIKYYIDKCLNSIFFFIGLTVVLLGVYFYFGLGSGAREALIGQVLHREQANARTGASSIATFFDLAGKTVVEISSHDEVISPSAETDEIFAAFIKRWENTPVTSIILLEEEGMVVKAAYTQVTGGVGVSLADRDYFLWAKTAQKGEYYVSGAIKSRLRGEDYYVVVVTSPVIDENGNFQGVLAIGISLSRLTEQYLTHLKISDKTEIYLIRPDGTFLYAPYRELLEVNVYDFIKAHPFLGSEILIEKTLKEGLESNREGKARIAYPEKVGTALPLKERMLAYAPVPVYGQDWMLVISTPVEDALIAMGPIYARFLIGLLVVFLILLAMGVRLAKITAYKEAKEKLEK